METTLVKQPWYLYIVQCSDESLYTGITTDLARRVREHNRGTGARSLRGKRPVRLVYHETYTNVGEARKREYAIKQWPRENKIKLILAKE
ncbi:GIY-YIG nuclease family protein [Candidatus Gottesmanbacteria bacterium]|nr:GIY-YIG nuclease family protein [Candidatus Gottesmanbacteria bacterium]